MDKTDKKRTERSAMAAFDHFRVAILATDGVEEVELTEPAKALGQASARQM
jgi:hypothetical protein